MKKITDVEVILASTSPRRDQLLDLIGIQHRIAPSDVEETQLPGEEPAAYAERLARAKADAIAVSAREALVIGADTIVVIDNDVLEKPRNVDDAQRMLGRLSGGTHVVMTAVAASYEGKTLSTVEKVSVTFRRMLPDEVSSYIKTGEPMDKAGAYGIQGYGATIVTRIDGDYFAVMGLSLIRLVELITSLGIRYDFGR